MAEMISMRKAYGEALVELGRKNEKVVAISADVNNSDFSYMFQEQFPDRFYNVGIAEQSLVDVAVGFAYTGRIPYANTFAFLFATRALEMIRTHLCYGGANVKLMGAYGGLSDSFDGPTHNSITDLAIMRALPRMTIVVPGDSLSVTKMLPLTAEWNGPMYVRLNRNEVPTIYDDSFKPEIGKAVTVRDGNDVTIITCGYMLHRSLQAADQLKGQGIDARVIDMHTIKPLDTKAVLKAAEDTGAIVTAEEASIIGGLGGAVAETLSDARPVPVKRVGIADRFSETGPYEQVLDAYGMGVKDIVNAAKSAVGMKKK